MHLDAALIVSFPHLIAATCFRDSGPTDWSCIRRDKEPSKRKKIIRYPAIDRGIALRELRFFEVINFLRHERKK